MALVAVAACALDSEEKVRAQLTGWMSLGETTYFKSTSECTAAVFETGAESVQNSVRRVSSLRQGLSALEQGATVAFMLDGQTPNQVSEAVMSTDLPKGLGILSSGLQAKNCLDEALSRAYLATLHSDKALLIFAPENNALAVLDRQGQQVFFARGNV